MDINQAIYGRRAVREYTDKAVDDETMGLLIRAAVQAPSAVNQQPWAFTVVRDRKTLDELSQRAKSHMLATMAASPHTGHFQTLLGAADFHIFYHAPALVLIATVAEGPWMVEDCSLAAENLMLAAYAQGLGTCWIGFAQSFLGTADGKKLLGLAPACVPIAPIIVGYPRAFPEAVPRNEPRIRWVG